MKELYMRGFQVPFAFQSLDAGASLCMELLLPRDWG